MTHNKRKGLLWIIIPIITLFLILGLFGLLTVLWSTGGSTMPIAIKAIFPILATLNVFAILIGIGVGIYFLVKKEEPPSSPLDPGVNSVPALASMEQPASTGKRFTNYIIDYLVLLALGFVVGLTHSATFTMPGGQWKLQVLSIGVALGYFIVFEALFHRTLGKLISGTKVVRFDGGRPTFLQIIGRSLARFIPFEPLSYLFYGSHPVGWHDRISKTLVVPRKYTVEQVQRIDISKIKATKYKGLIIIVSILVTIIFLGLVSSVVLVSLTAAREKAQLLAEQFEKPNEGIKLWTSQYVMIGSKNENFCNIPMVQKQLSDVALGEVKCITNDNGTSVVFKLTNGNSFCADSLGAKIETAGSFTSDGICKEVPPDNNDKVTAQQEELVKQSVMNTVQAEHGNPGFCSDIRLREYLLGITGGYKCFEENGTIVVSFPLPNGNNFCVDSKGTTLESKSVFTDTDPFCKEFVPISDISSFLFFIGKV